MIEMIEGQISKSVCFFGCLQRKKGEVAQGQCINKNMRFLCAILFTVAVFILIAAAGNTATVEKTSACDMRLEGEIDSSTPSLLAANYASLKSNPSLKNKPPCKSGIISLHLNSTGGDIEAAMKAGEFVRQKKIWTEVDSPEYDVIGEQILILRQADTCASACVFVLLGGVFRSANGDIGVHRPFSDRFFKSESEAKIQYERVNHLIKQYLNIMNIPETLLDIMNSVPPSKVKWLTPEQLEETHISGTDPVYDDQLDSSEAKGLGISKKELYAREQRANAICNDLMFPFSIANYNRYEKCRRDVMEGRR